MTPTLQVPSLPRTPLPKLGIEKLRQYRNTLIEEESKASYWRRLVQIRLNLIARQRTEGYMPIEDMIRGLGATGSGHRRQQLLSVEAAEELPQLPGLDDLWTQDPDLSDPEGLEVLVVELQKVERQLSDYRNMVHERLDAATAELVARYKSDPAKCLDLFPVDVR